MKIKTSQFCIILFFLMQSCLLGYIISGSIKYAGVNFWIIPILGTLFGFPIFLMYLYIFNYKKNMDINNLNIHLFGKFGKFINTLLILFITIFSILLFWNLCNFVSSQYLYRTPPIFVEIIFIITILFVLHNGTDALFRTTLILFYILVIIFIINFVGLFPQIKINNLKPMFFGNFNLILGTFEYIVFSICPIFLLLIFPKDKIENKKLNKKLIGTYFISNFSIFSIMFFIISVFGINLVNLYQYPDYHILKRVTIFGFEQRFEKILAIYWILIIFISVIFGIYYIFKSLKSNFKIKKSMYFILFGTLYLNHYIFENNTQASNIMEKIFPYAIFGFLVVIPFIIFIRIVTKKRLSIFT